MKIIKVGNEYISGKELFKHSREGGKFVCAKCNFNLITAFTIDEAKKKGIVPGLYCPKNINHVNIHFHLKDERDNKIRDLLSGK